MTTTPTVMKDGESTRSSQNVFLTSSQELVMNNFALDPLLNITRKCKLVGICFKRAGSSVDNIGPRKFCCLLSAVHANNGDICDVWMCQEYTLQFRGRNLEPL